MTHIVNFEWCKDCKYGKQDEESDPCDRCLDEPAKEDGTRPVYFVESDEYRKHKEKEKQLKEKKEAKNNARKR